MTFRKALIPTHGCSPGALLDFCPSFVQVATHQPQPDEKFAHPTQLFSFMEVVFDFESIEKPQPSTEKLEGYCGFLYEWDSFAQKSSCHMPVYDAPGYLGNG